MFKHAGFAAAALAASLAAAPAPAAVIVTFNEVGSNVVGSFSGSLSLPFFVDEFGTSHPFVAGSSDLSELALYPGVSAFVTNGSATIASLMLFSASGPLPTSFAHDYGFGGTSTIGNNATGDPLGVWMHVIGVPAGSITGMGSSLAGTFTFLNQSFATMSVLPGEYTYTLMSPFGVFDGDTVTLQFGPEIAAVPVPETLPLMLGALGGVAVAARRMRQRDGDAS